MRILLLGQHRGYSLGLRIEHLEPLGNHDRDLWKQKTQKLHRNLFFRPRQRVSLNRQVQLLCFWGGYSETGDGS